MFLDKYEYDLPEELIANRPIRPRDSSRLLIVNKKSGKVDLGSISAVSYTHLTLPTKA